MNITKVKYWVGVLLVGFSLLLAFAQSPVQDQIPVSPTAESWKQTAANISQADQAPQKDVVRQERSGLFDAQSQDVQRLDSTDPGRHTQEGTPFVHLVETDPIPIKESDAVVVGSVNSFQPYFSNDHTHIYTEFTISIDQQIKDNTQTLRPGNTAPIVLHGGAIRLSDGRVVRDKVVKTNFKVAVGSRYIFFLHFSPKGRYFIVLKNWELKNGSVIPTSPEDTRNETQGRSHYSAMREKDFIQAVQQAAATSQAKQ